MEASPILALLIPVYHEEDSIGSLLNEIEKCIKIPVKVYILYDYEEDPTLPVVKSLKDNLRYPVELVKNRIGKGVLNAILTGFTTFEEEACVVIMADASDDLNTINGMYGLFCQGFHIVCGSRYMRNGAQLGGTWFKKALSRLAGVSLYYITRLPTHDVTNSFKLYSKPALEKIEFESSGGFEIGMEIVVKSFINGLAITEVPTTWRDRYEGTSKFKLWAWLPKYLKWYFYLIFRSNILIRHKEPVYNKIRQVGY